MEEVKVKVLREKKGEPTVIEWNGKIYILQPKTMFRGGKK